jgi:endonuclease III
MSDTSGTNTQEQERVERIIAKLRAAYPDARCSLDFKTPFELLVATILAAQCTDERVNMVTPNLFAAYPTPQAFAEADPAELEQALKQINFYRNKAKNIREMARLLVERFAGQVPSTMEELTSLPGVARKTANVVLSNAFGLVEGYIVDTHNIRLARRLGLTTNEDPAKIERDLMAVVPRADWLDFSHLLIYHGRAVCQARKPLCPECVIASDCPTGLINLSASGSPEPSAAVTPSRARRTR